MTVPEIALVGFCGFWIGFATGVAVCYGRAA